MFAKLNLVTFNEQVSTIALVAIERNAVVRGSLARSNLASEKPPLDGAVDGNLANACSRRTGCGETVGPHNDHDIDP